MNETLQQKSGELFRLLQPHRTSDVMQRINLHVVNKTGKKLPEYIQNGATIEEKTALLDELIGIITRQEWDRLPAVPNGQATPAQTKPAATTASAPKAVATPKPTALSPAVAMPAPTGKSSASAVSGDLVAQLGAILAQLLPAPAVPAEAQLTRADVGQVVREELARVFMTTAEVLKK